MTTTREAQLEAALRKIVKDWDGEPEDMFEARAALSTPATEPQGLAHIVDYTNWRGETARRVIRPIRMWWGKTEWHPEEQWMLTAWDCEKDAVRDFAWQDMRPVQNPATSAAARLDQPAADETIYREGFPDGWHMVHRSDATLLCRKSDAGYAFAVSTAFAAAPKLMQGEAWLSTAQALAWGMVNHRKAEMAYDEKTFCDHCGYGPKRDDDDKILPNSLATKTWTCDNCDHVNVRSPQPAAEGRVTVKPLVWEDCNSTDGTPYWRADSVLGGYGIYCRSRKYEMDGEFYATLELAQSAAQEHYTTAILSALTLTAPSDKIAEAARVVTPQEAAQILYDTMTTNRPIFDAMVEAAEDIELTGVSFNRVVGDALRAAIAWKAPDASALVGQGETP